MSNVKWDWLEKAAQDAKNTIEQVYQEAITGLGRPGASQPPTGSSRALAAATADDHVSGKARGVLELPSA